MIDLMEVSEHVGRGDPMAAYAASYNELEERLRANLAAVLAAAEARDTARARQLIASFTPEEENGVTDGDTPAGTARLRNCRVVG